AARRGGADDRLGRARAGRPPARDVRRPRVRGRPRLHRHPRARRLLHPRLGGRRRPRRGPVPAVVREVAVVPDPPLSGRRAGVSGFLEPAYGVCSLADVLPSVSFALGARVADWPDVPTLALPEAPAYVVFLVDGLGAELLAGHAH